MIRDSLENERTDEDGEQTPDQSRQTCCASLSFSSKESDIAQEFPGALKTADISVNVNVTSGQHGA